MFGRTGRSFIGHTSHLSPIEQAISRNRLERVIQRYRVALAKGVDRGAHTTESKTRGKGVLWVIGIEHIGHGFKLRRKQTVARLSLWRVMCGLAKSPTKCFCG